MYFKRIEMHGFKSFAEPVVIDFHEGITCIVGPNGSGKSNISDAIRWVLGEQSPKALRGGKMEEVIFAGTASRKSRGMAEVTLVIDNSTGILDIDYNEVAITRRMFRSGESEYLINNNQCRLRDIRELIMDTGIGVDGYSIIGQGKIADIVSNKPESRREIFEEAAGIVMYKSKKTEAERKLDSTSNNLERVNDIIAEIEDRIDGLKEDSEKASEYLKLKDRYRDLEINITLKNIDNINSRNENFRTDINNLAASIDKLKEQKESADKELDQSRIESDNISRLGNDAKDKILDIAGRINALSSESEINKERLAGIERDDKRLNEEIKELETKLQNEDSNLDQLKQSEKEIEKKHKEAKDGLQEKIVSFNEITEKSTACADRIDTGKEQLFKLHNLVTSKNGEAKSIENLKETLVKRKKQIENESADINQNTRDNQNQLADAETERKRESEKSGKADDKLRELKKELSLTEQRKQELVIQIQDLRIKGSQASSRMKTIEEMENNYEGYNYAVKSVMKARLKGVEGVVAELMTVPSGYEVAIETALGGALQNIVCDTDMNAKGAVNYLKQNRAGRLTFLPVESIHGRKAEPDSRIINEHGYKGIAADCIEFEPRYENVFNYLLGRVIVVDNMDTALKLSKTAVSGMRIVTLEGEIINASGAITGGRYRNRTADLLERKAEIATLKEQVEKFRNQMLQAADEQKENISKAERLEEELKKVTEEKRVADLAVASLDSTLSALRTAILDTEQSRSKFETELSAIDKEMSEADSMAANLHKEAEDAIEQIALLEKQIDADTDTYENMRQSVEQANEDITRSRIAANEWENKKSNLIGIMERINSSIDDYNFQISDKKHQLVLLEEEKNTIVFGSGDSQADIEKLINERKSLEEYIEKLTEEKNQLTEKENKLSEIQKTAGEKLNSFQDQKYQLEIKAAKNETQLDSMKERLWEDFEISYAQALDLRKPDFVMSPAVKESREIKNRIRELGEVNVGSIREYESVSKRYKFLTEQRSDITTAMDELKTIIDDMDSTIKTRFKSNFDQVVVNFEIIFKELFGGGTAELRMDDEDNPLESGIDIIAQPPGKKLQNINLMSGGEKTMTAIALMFAVLKTKPTPFCILDEVEAALDDANIDRFAGYLRKFTDIQFALITHQKATMEHADVLYGVTMPEHGVSKVLSLRLGDDFDI